MLLTSSSSSFSWKSAFCVLPWYPELAADLEALCCCCCCWWWCCCCCCWCILLSLYCWWCWTCCCCSWDAAMAALWWSVEDIRCCCCCGGTCCCCCGAGPDVVEDPLAPPLDMFDVDALGGASSWPSTRLRFFSWTAFCSTMPWYLMLLEEKSKTFIKSDCFFLQQTEGRFICLYLMVSEFALSRCISGSSAMAVNFPLDASKSAWYLELDWILEFSARRFISGVSATTVALAFGTWLRAVIKGRKKG